jgi:hypothetical protein
MIGKDELYSEELDKILFERVMLISKQHPISEDEELKNKISEYYRLNEKFGAIKIPPLKIFASEKIYESNLTTQFYTVPLKFEKRSKDEINRLIKNDIIEVCRVPFASPSFMIEKKNKELRLVVDYRKINEYIYDDIAAIPKIFDNLWKVGQSKVFTKIDLKNGFNQIVLDDKSRDLTSFTMHGMQYRYKRVPFGIKSGPKIFQRTINEILKGINNCNVYIDDILIYADD